MPPKKDATASLSTTAPKGIKGDTPLRVIDPSVQRLGRLTRTKSGTAPCMIGMLPDDSRPGMFHAVRIFGVRFERVEHLNATGGWEAERRGGALARLEVEAFTRTMETPDATGWCSKHMRREAGGHHD